MVLPPIGCHMGSPPRVRSRPQRLQWMSYVMRITSACAEQTVARSMPACPNWDHLRVCGADYAGTTGTMPDSGSPPRVRSRRTVPFLRRAAGRDHLRVCGADDRAGCGAEERTGSPPRVRSRHRHALLARPFAGITSACAEQTNGTSTEGLLSGDHLRVCGADMSMGLTVSMTAGSPPRVRSRPRLVNRYRGSRGITSACAEQTGGEFAAVR